MFTYTGNKMKFQCLIKHHIREMCGKEAVEPPTLPMRPDTDEWSAACSGYFTPMGRTMACTEQRHEAEQPQKPAWT
jgi:hypothetical protein